MNFANIFDHKTKNVNTAAAILAVSALISRLLGVVRDWLLAKQFGAGADLDIYFAAFKIPDFVYNVLILGGVLVAFLPLFSDYYSKDKKKAWVFTSNLLNIFLLLLIVLCLVLFLITPALTGIIAPGFEAEKLEKTILLTRIMFLSPIFFGLSSIFSGILQYFNRFLAYGLCPILYNLGIIFGILFFSPSIGILGVALGVVSGAFLHFAFQVPSAINCGFSYKKIIDFKDKSMKKVFTLMFPRTFGVSASQINLVVINAIASTLAEGSISIFNFANNIQYFPIGIIGASFAMAVFPSLSKSWSMNKDKEFSDSFSLIFRQIVYLVFPLSILIFFLRKEIVDLVLRHGQFTPSAADLTSASLALFSIGLLSSSLMPLLFRTFFSLKDTKTPTLIAVISIINNILLSFWLTKILFSPRSCLQAGFKTLFVLGFSLFSIEDISVLGLPVAISLSSILQFILLLFFLKLKLRGLNFDEILKSFLKVFMSSVFMIILISFTFSFIKSGFSGNNTRDNFLRLITVSFIGFAGYLISTFLLGSSEIKAIKSFLEERFFKNRIHGEH